MSNDFDATSGRYIEDNFGPIGITHVTNYQQFLDALDAFKASLDGNDADECASKMAYLQSVLNGTATANLADGSLMHGLVKSALEKASPQNKDVADYVARQLRDFYK